MAIGAGHETASVWHEPPILTEDDLAITDWPLLSRVLRARGARTREEADRFLSPRRLPLGDPFLLPDMSRAVTLIRSAIERGARIGVFGDYDVDGISSTAMLVRALRKLGADPIPMIPHRMSDGYGVTPAAVERIVGSGVDLVITVDCGSSSPAEFATLVSLGVQAIVLDHHHCSDSLPADVCFVSARRVDNEYPCLELAAAGVTFSFLRALLGEADAEMYLPYVALGTVADVVELTGENRGLVAQGIASLRRWKLPGFAALCSVAGLDQRAITSWQIGHAIGPRLNAAGRIDTPQVALDLLLADDLASATPLAVRLNLLNQQRREETLRAQQEAESALFRLGGPEACPAIVLADESWSIGIAGLVASRLAERFNRPTIILERGTETSRGSARSFGSINIMEALSASSALLERFGGHRNAAGLSLATANIDALRRELSATVFDSCGGQMPAREIIIDAEAQHDDLWLETVDVLNCLEPFGRGNEQPTLLVRGLEHRYAKTSADGRHLLFQVVGADRRAHRAVLFGSGDRLDELTRMSRIDVVAGFVRDTWQGSNRLQLHVIDFRPATRDSRAARTTPNRHILGGL